MARRRLKYAALATLVMALGSRGASAQSDAGAPSPLLPPVAIDAGQVPYPEGARGDATVVVQVVVSVDGHVTSAQVTEGAEPFASAALAAASAWTFKAATRGEVPVASRIKMRVEFHAPVSAPAPATASAPAPASATASAPASAPASASATASAPEAVRVRGARQEVGETRLGGGEVRQIPGAFGDAFRAIEALPGVTPIVSGLPFFFVRGAPPGNTGYFIDGVRVPLLYHLALGPSVVHPGLIDHVDFYPGGYPARFGRFAGGILSGETLAPAAALHGEGNIRIFDAGALVEAPLLGGKLTILAAGRYSYTAAVVELVAPDTRVAYWDYQLRAAFELSKKDRVSAFWFGSFDEIDNRDHQRTYDRQGGVTSDTVGPFYPVFKTEFHRLDLRYDHDSARGHLRVAATLGLDDSTAGSGASQSATVGDRLFGLRTEADERQSDVLKFRYGADVQLLNYSLAQSGSQNADAQALYPNRNDVMIGTYADALWKASARVEVIPGLRFDVFTSRLAGQPTTPTSLPPGGLGVPLAAPVSASAAVGVDPRLATRFAATRAVTWVSTFGVSHQPPSFLVPVPGLDLGRLTHGLQTSLQMSQGVEVKLPLDFTVTATGFLHDYLDLSDATATCVDFSNASSSGISNSCLDERVRGRAFGLELLLKRDLTKRFTGWLSYTLSRSTRETKGLIVVGPGDFGPAKREVLTEIPSEFDRTHVFNLIGAFDLGKGFRAGARFYYYTGRPYSASIQGIPVPPFNGERLPDFFRIDLRVEKRFRVFGRASISVVLEGMNITLNKEAIGVSCQHDGSFAAQRFDTCAPQYIGPVTVPSLGVEGSF